MRLIVAGSRGIRNYNIVAAAIEEALNEWSVIVEEIIEGECKDSPDEAGARWGYKTGVPVYPMRAAWDDLDAPGAVIRRNRYGELYNARAGFDRNEKMAQRAAETPPGGLVLVHYGNTPGSLDMRGRARAHGLLIHEVIIRS